jgi:hypothetical protein
VGFLQCLQQKTKDYQLFERFHYVDYEYQSTDYILKEFFVFRKYCTESR